MKKLFLLLAVAALFVACGGNDKKNADGKLQKTEQTKEKDTEDNGEKSAEGKLQKTEQTKEQKQDPKEAPKANLTVAQMLDGMYDALQNGDQARFIELAVKSNSWGEAQQEEILAYVAENQAKFMVVITAIQNTDFSEYECCDEHMECADECCGEEETMFLEGECCEVVECCGEEEPMFYEGECCEVVECCDEDYEWSDDEGDDWEW